MRICRGYSRRAGGDLSSFPPKNGGISRVSFSKGGEGNSSQFCPVVMIRELGTAFLQGQIQRNGRLVWEENFLRRACFVMFVPYRWLMCPPPRSNVDGLDQQNGCRESDVETIRRS